MGKRFEELSARGMVHAIELSTGKELPGADRARLIRGPDEEDLVNSGLEETMATAFRQIRGVHAANPKIPDLRTAAFVSAIEKIALSYMELGIFP
jgi:glutamate dehydrogenase (NAD(P)+)